MFLRPARRVLSFPMALAVLVFFSVQVPLTAAELTFDKARIRELIPGQNKTSAYFDITNEGSAEVSLVGVASDSAQAIEIHTILHNGDMVRMMRLSQVVLPPGETIRFRSGNLHLMLFEVTALPEETE